jgi:hypothetical protein
VQNQYKQKSQEIKKNIIVVASVTAAGGKFPLQLIATGKAKRVETTQNGSVDEHWRVNVGATWMVQK